MDVIFEVVDKTGRKIRLTRERWTHITSPANLHPYMTNYFEEVKTAILNPDIVIQDKFDESKANYYKYEKKEKCYLFISAKIFKRRRVCYDIF